LVVALAVPNPAHLARNHHRVLVLVSLAQALVQVSLAQAPLVNLVLAAQTLVLVVQTLAPALVHRNLVLARASLGWSI